ncbi:MAG: HAMP domain-containing protein [Bacteroidales bacterium]|nr:HAMP domain-containing protein [Bacteroidales bacterium]MBN2756032.1 HAMP domain-containing protein [Bacteroidales bacterium]
MKNLKISYKLIISFAVILLLFAISMIYIIVNVNKMANLQHHGFKSGLDVIEAEKASSFYLDMSLIIADTEIHRNFNLSEQKWDKEINNIDKIINNIENQADTDQEIAWIEESKKIKKEISTIYKDDLIPSLKKDTSGTINNQIHKIDAKLEKLLTDFAIPFTNMEASFLQEYNEANEIFDTTAESIFKAAIILSVIVLTFAILIIISLVNSIVPPILKSLDFANKIAEGDLSATIEIIQNDEIGKMTYALNDMIKKLKSIVTDIIVGADHVASASLQISSTAQQMSQGSNEQASSIEEVSSTMEEINANIQQSTSNSKETENIANKAAADIKDTSKSVLNTVESMKIIADKISIISEIANQTNMLALNAAVEAARAGKRGKGFAVVASEVKSLAERSSLAAEEIDKVAAESVMIAENSGEMLSEIVPSIEKTATLVQEISTASMEQSSSTDQISNAINQLNNVTQQNSAISEELASSSEELSSQAEQLKHTISFFKLDASNLHKKTFVKKSSSIKRVVDTNFQKKEKTNVTKAKIEQPKNSIAENPKGYKLDLDSNRFRDDDFERY